MLTGKEHWRWGNSLFYLSTIPFSQVFCFVLTFHGCKAPLITHRESLVILRRSFNHKCAALNRHLVQASQIATTKSHYNFELQQTGHLRHGSDHAGLYEIRQ